MTPWIRITPFDDRYAADFSRLNRAWLQGIGLLEAADAMHLDRPRQSIIDPGGQIFFAMANPRPVGTCAVIPHGKRWFEIAKLAVSPERASDGGSLTPPSLMPAAPGPKESTWCPAPCFNRR